MPTRRLIIAPTAYDDLEQIWHYIAVRSGEDSAAKVAAALVNEFDELAEIPGVGHEREEAGDPDVRFWPVYSYLIAYRFDDQTLRVSRVIHGHRDLRRIAFP